MKTYVCKSCNAICDENANFCHSCGALLIKENITPTSVDPCLDDTDKVNPFTFSKENNDDNNASGVNIDENNVSNNSDEESFYREGREAFFSTSSDVKDRIPPEQYNRVYDQYSHYPSDINFNQNDSTNVLLVVLSVFFPLVGLIVFLVQKDTSPKTSKACGIAGLISWVLSILLYLLAFFIKLSLFNLAL